MQLTLVADKIEPKDIKMWAKAIEGVDTSDVRGGNYINQGVFARGHMMYDDGDVIGSFDVKDFGAPILVGVSITGFGRCVWIIYAGLIDHTDKRTAGTIDMTLTGQYQIHDYFTEFGEDRYDYSKNTGKIADMMAMVASANPFYIAGQIILNTPKLLSRVNSAKPLIEKYRQENKNAEETILYGHGSEMIEGKVVELPPDILFMSKTSSGVWILGSLAGGRKNVTLGDVLAEYMGSGKNVDVFLTDQARALKELAYACEIIAMGYRGGM